MSSSCRRRRGIIIISSFLPLLSLLKALISIKEPKKDSLMSLHFLLLCMMNAIFKRSVKGRDDTGAKPAVFGGALFFQDCEGYT